MKKWERVRKTIATAAPALGRALSLPGSELVGNMIGAALGVPATPEAIESHIVANPADIAKIAEIDATLTSAFLADVQDARAAHKGHWMPPVLTLLLLALFTATIAGLFLYEIPNANRDMANIAFGTLLGSVGTAIAYWLGSSRGDMEKQALLGQRE